MSRPYYDVKESYTGTGSLDSYSFDFKITSLLHLLVLEYDSDGVETQRVRGDDNTYLDSVTFDASEGGGTVTLAANLPSGYSLVLLLANDEPTQDYEFRNKTSFTLRRFEDALDAILGAVQRLVYRVNQTVRINDLDDEEAFNGQLPAGIADNAGKVFIINEDGDGLEFGPTADQIANAQGYAEQLIAAGVPTFVEFNGPTSGTLNRGEFGIIRAGASFALALDNIGLVPGDRVEVKRLGFTGVLTVTPTGANIDGAASKVFAGSTNASYTFRFTGTEWIVT